MAAPLVMVSPTGARFGKGDHPNLPVTTEEIASSAAACFEAGAQALHLHVRDAQGQHSLDAGRYREAMSAVGEVVPEIAVQVTTESGGVYGPEDQLALIRSLSPKWASASLRELARNEAVARRFYALCADQGVHIQHIVYDAKDAALLAHWQDQGVLGQAESVILVLGHYTSKQEGRPEDIPGFLAALPPTRRWMICAFGAQEHACLRAAARLGGDVRVGFENALTDETGAMWPNVESSVRALVRSLGAVR